MDIKKSLGIQRNEKKPILMLISYSFFMGLAIAFYFTATISDFLSHYRIEVLPYTYVLSGVLGYLLWLLWAYFEKKFTFSTRLLIGMNLLLVSVVLLFIGVLFLEVGWLSFLMLVWVRVFIFVNMVNFWGMAGKLFNLSQGKRLFGLISVGTVISDIVGFFSIPLILYLGMHNYGLIVLSIISLSVCLVITYMITIRFSRHLRSIDKTEAIEVKRKKKRGPFFKGDYQRYLFFLAILPMFGFYFVDYAFLDRIKLNFAGNSDAIASYMGGFFGLVALVELAVKSGVFSRILYHFGLRIALLVLPVVLLISTALGLTVGVWPWAAGFIFPAIALTKLMEKALRSGVSDPSFQILFQPIPLKERLAFQSKMEGVPSALGNIAAGGLILLLIHFKLTDSIWLNIIFMMVIAIWILVAFRTHDQYKGVIENKLKDNELHDKSIASKRSTERLVERFHDGSADMARRSLQLLDLIGRGISKSLLRSLSEHDSKEVQQDIDQIGRRYNTESPEREELRNMAERQGPDSLKEQINTLMRSGMKIDKLLAIELLEMCTDGLFVKKRLTELLLADEPEIVHATFNILPQPLDEFTAQFIIDNLEKTPLNQIALPELRKQGAETEHLIVRKLMQFEAGQWHSMYQQLNSLQLIEVLEDIGGAETQNYLIRLIEFGNSEVKQFALDALCTIGLPPGGLDESYFRQKIEQEANHYTWLLASIEDLSEEPGKFDEVIRPLKVEVLRSRDRLLSALTFVYPRATIEQIRSNILRGETESNILALEMCELILSPALKEIMVPVIMDVSRGEKLKNLSREFPQQSFSPIDRIKEIVYHDFARVNTWIKIVSMNYLIELVDEIPREIYANLHINNPTIKEQAYITMHALKPEEYYRKVVIESPDFQLYMKRVLGTDPGIEQLDSMLIRVKKLKTLPLFKDMYEVILIKIAYAAVRIELEGENMYSRNYPDFEMMHFVINGSLRMVDPDSDELISYTTGDVIGLFDTVDLRKIRFEAQSKTELMAIRKEYFFTLVSVYEDLSESLIDQSFASIDLEMEEE